MQEAIFTLNDKRKISYAVYGPDDGKPVLYFHGTPSSRKEILLLQSFGVEVEDLLYKLNLKIIAPDRGALTTHDPKRSFFSFAADAEQLLRHLGVQHCPVLCWSGGGPYSLAMAYRYPELIEGVYILCGITRRIDKAVLQQMGLNKWYFITGRYTPFLLYAGLSIMRHKETAYLPPQKFTGLPYVDYRLLQPTIKTVAGVTMKEATRKGAGPMVHEAANYSRDYGFSLKDIVQPIHYWWGTLDMAVVELHALEIEQHAQHAVMHYREGEGHLSLYVNYFGEALQAISRAAATGTDAGR